MGIAELLRTSATSHQIISIGGGLPASELFPRVPLTAAFVDAMNDPQCCALQYDWPEGQDSLREWVARRLRARGAEVRGEDVLITAGAQQGLSLAAHFLLPRGARVQVDAETYPAALELFEARGAKVVTDGEDADCVYLIDGIGNPRGLSPAPEVRARLISERRPVIADEAYAELQFSGPLLRPLLADGRDHVWHVGTLSKTLSPGLRIGWLVPPEPMLQRTIELKQTRDLQSASLSQVIAERFLSQDDFDARLDKARRFYVRRATALMDAVRRHLPEWRFVEPAGGFSIFVELDQRGDAEAWLRSAMAHGVAFDPGPLFRPRGREGGLAMRLCFSATAPKRLLEAVRRIAKAWQQHRKQGKLRLALRENGSAIRHV